MNPPTMTNRKAGMMLARKYQTALHRYLTQGRTPDLKPAARLGLQAAAIGFETLDLALIHVRAADSYSPPGRASAIQKDIEKNARAFFAEALSPIEDAQHAALESDIKMSRLNAELKRYAIDLSASRRKLKAALARRKIVEQALRQKELRFIRLLEQSKLQQGHMRQLSRRILTAQEEERKRISRELHDVIAQMLTGINIRLETLKTKASSNKKDIAKSILHTQRLVEKSVDIVHQFARELRPEMLDDLGLIPALYSHMTEFTKTTGIRASLTAFAGVEELSSVKRTTIYRIAQEALANIALHAKASCGKVVIEKIGEDVLMLITDNGKSFNVEQALHAEGAKRLGLLGMRERVEMIGGALALESEPGRGTTVKIQFPFAGEVETRQAI